MTYCSIPDLDDASFAAMKQRLTALTVECHGLFCAVRDENQRRLARRLINERDVGIGHVVQVEYSDGPIKCVVVGFSSKYNSVTPQIELRSFTKAGKPRKRLSVYSGNLKWITRIDAEVKP
jgi:hypothetical protein